VDNGHTGWGAKCSVTLPLHIEKTSAVPDSRLVLYIRTIPCRDPWENDPTHMNAEIPERRPATEEISGLIERVTFHNDESGFCVLRVKARGQRDETTVVGSLSSVTAGEWLSAERPHAGGGIAALSTIAKTPV
jgi:hypothetical protein